MSTNAPSKSKLSSKWDGLNKHLLAHFFVVSKNQSGIWLKSGELEVIAPLTDANIELSLGWQSPFENASSDNVAPTLAAMVQSGEADQALQAVGLGGDGFMHNIAADFSGRTGITKLNSTQVFNGMPPVKISVSAVFRALTDPIAEVEKPLNQLIKWALPPKIAMDGGLVTRTIKAASGDYDNKEDYFMPSIAPVKVGLTYKGRTFAPLVIENISLPFNAPIDQSGKFTQITTNLTLCTLTALDRSDWINTQNTKL